jgi:NTE family protein
MAKSKPECLRNGEKAVLVLQGGGALGAYQAGVLEELHETGIEPNWVAGISIGAINAAIIAGNPPERRVERLNAFWELVTSKLRGRLPYDGASIHEVFNEASAFMASAWGVPGFFRPRPLPPFMAADRSINALSFYDSSDLKATLEKLVDFKLLNSGAVRLSVGAVHIKSGNVKYFDTTGCKIGPEHIMASGALPPGLPPVMIKGEAYWDGGIVSNAPLQAVLDDTAQSDLAVFQVDVFSASGEMPQTIFDVYEREKEIRFSSRTRLNTDVFVRERRAQQAVGRLLEQLPPELQQSADVEYLRSLVPRYGTTVMHLIYHKRPFEASTYDYEFSRLSMEEHWKAGRASARHSLTDPRWLERKIVPGNVVVIDHDRPDKKPEMRPGRIHLEKDSDTGTPSTREERIGS